MNERTHHITGKPIGKWERCQGQRYWDGPCSCGSGREGHEEYDDNGILFGISCKSCKRVAQPGPYDEPIEED